MNDFDAFIRQHHGLLSQCSGKSGTKALIDQDNEEISSPSQSGPSNEVEQDSVGNQKAKGCQQHARQTENSLIETLNVIGDEVNNVACCYLRQIG